MLNLFRRVEAWMGRQSRSPGVTGLAPEGPDVPRLSPAEFRRLASMPPEQIARMETMARVNGLDPARLDRSHSVRIATALTCSECREQGRCRAALESGALRAATDFCPNVETYRMLASAC